MTLLPDSGILARRAFATGTDMKDLPLLSSPANPVGSSFIVGAPRDGFMMIPSIRPSSVDIFKIENSTQAKIVI